MKFMPIYLVYAEKMKCQLIDNILIYVLGQPTGVTFQRKGQEMTKVVRFIVSETFMIMYEYNMLC